MRKYGIWLAVISAAAAMIVLFGAAAQFYSYGYYVDENDLQGALRPLDLVTLGWAVSLGLISVSSVVALIRTSRSAKITGRPEEPVNQHS